MPCSICRSPIHHADTCIDPNITYMANCVECISKFSIIPNEMTEIKQQFANCDQFWVNVWRKLNMKPDFRLIKTTSSEIVNGNQLLGDLVRPYKHHGKQFLERLNILQQTISIESGNNWKLYSKLKYKSTYLYRKLYSLFRKKNINEDIPGVKADVTYYLGFKVTLESNLAEIINWRVSLRSRRINASDNEYVERLIANYRNREQLDGFPWLPETIDDGESLWIEVVFVARNRYLTQYAESTSATTTNINFNIPNSIFQNYTIDHQNAQVLETKQSILKDVVLKMEDSKVHYFVDDICNICMETINSSEIFALNCKHSF